MFCPPRAPLKPREALASSPLAHHQRHFREAGSCIGHEQRPAFGATRGEGTRLHFSPSLSTPSSTKPVVRSSDGSACMHDRYVGLLSVSVRRPVFSATCPSRDRTL